MQTPTDRTASVLLGPATKQTHRAPENLLDALDLAVESGAPFLTFHSGKSRTELSYETTRERALTIAHHLHALGAMRGARVALLVPTSPLFVEALLGTMMAGLVPVPLASPMTFGGVDRYLNNLGELIENADARILITYPRMSEGVKASPRLSLKLEHVLSEEDLQRPPRRTSNVWTAPSIDASDLAFLQYTSGTTGTPKGVMISHRAIVHNTTAIARGLRQTDADVGVSWLPVFHDMGLIGALLKSIVVPGPLHLLTPERFVVRPASWLKLLTEVGGTLSPAPNFAYELSAERAHAETALDLSRWRVALSGSEPVLGATVRRFGETFAGSGFSPNAFMPVYGLAEATLAVTFSELGAGARGVELDRRTLELEGRAMMMPPREGRKPAELRETISVGRPLEGMSISVRDPEGAVCARGTVGEIWVSGPSLMSGYFQNEEATANVLSCDGLRTGDLGVVLGDELYVTGRAKDLIIKAGRNLHPADIEHVVALVPGVKSGAVAAFARDNPRSGTEDLVVVAEIDAHGSADVESLTRAIRGEVLAELGIGIDDVALWATKRVPRTSSGKVRRRACRALLESERQP